MGSDNKKGSLSRLSPSAQPFTLKRPNFSNPFLDDWQQYKSFCPFCSFLGQPSIAAPCSHCGGVGGGASSFSSVDYAPMTHANTYYSQCTSAAFPAPSSFACLSESGTGDLDALPVNYSSQQRFMVYKLGDGEGLWWRDEDKWTLGQNDKNGVIYVSHNASFKQAKSSPEGLKPCGQTSNSSGGKYIAMSGNYNEIRHKDIKKIDAKCVSVPISVSRENSRISTSLDLFCKAMHKDHQSTLSSLTSVEIPSCYNSKNTSYERIFPQQYDSSETKLRTYPSSESNILPALSSEQLVARTSYSLLDPDLSKNVNFHGHGAFNNKISSSYKPTCIKEPHVQLNTKDKEVFQDKLLTGKSNGEQNSNSVAHEVVDLLTMTDSKLQITCPSAASDLSQKLNGTKGSDCVENSHKMLGKDDSDLDSPCWKGTSATEQSTFGPSGPVNSQNVKSGQEVCSSLNPLAPQFFPSNDKGRENFCGSECDGDNSLSFLNIPSPAVNLPSKAHGLENCVVAGSSSSEFRNIIETHNSNDVHVPENENSPLCNNSSGDSTFSSSCMAQPLTVEDCIKSNGLTLMEPNVGGSIKGTKHTAHNASTIVSLLPTDDDVGSSSCRVGFPSDFTGTHGDASKSLIVQPRLDIHLAVNTMNELSELLMQNCSSDLDSLNECEQDTIKHVINNLSMCMKNMAGKRTLTPEQSNPYTSSCLTKPADPQKCANMELQATRTKTMMVSQKVGYQNENEGWKFYSANFSEQVLNSCSTIKNGVQNGQRVTQVMQKMLKEYQMEEEENPQASLYRNLWLEAEAALCLMKHKACAMKK